MTSLRTSAWEAKATATTFGAENMKFSFVFKPLVSDHLVENRAEIAWIIGCCNIIAFLGSTKDEDFSLGSTRFSFRK